MLVRKLQGNKSRDLSYFKNMQLFLECVLWLLPGLADRSELASDCLLQLDIVTCLKALQGNMFMLYSACLSQAACPDDWTRHS